MQRYIVVTFGIFSTIAVSAGITLFLKATPYFAWYAPYGLLQCVYLLSSYLIALLGKSFKLDKHKQLLQEHPATPESAPTIDIYLPICREPIEVLRNTWKYVLDVQYEPSKVRVYVLDDGDSAEVRQLAQEHGFDYIVRDNRPHLKKAGNMRHAFARTQGDFFCVFDADFCPRPDFFLELVPYGLSDPKTAIIQSPQFFRASREQTWVERGAGSVQEFFYRVVQTTRDTWGASICVGSNALYRREALAEVGGPAEIAFSEDVHTGFHAVCRGWKVVYVPINLACGGECFLPDFTPPAPSDVGSRVLTRHRSLP
jgi:cellulose synthase/poly-beta-1,6-N-acetylglucosamine synthase-like glycosyltransferase